MDIANRRPTRLALDMLDAQPGMRVLDAGCGTGAAIGSLLERTSCAVTGVDPSATMIAAARRRLGDAADLRQLAIEALPFGNGTFDAVMALNVLYFCDPDGALLHQIYRVLTPGGRLVAYVTHRDSMENWPFAREGVHRLFDSHELSTALCGGGFAQEDVCVHETAITASVTGLLAVAVKQG